ncbi:MAG: UDP-N-acetylmuramoyl-L-alanyl-D-glutamate--2,6-diaminopimelate ligase [Thermoguttaceae bacterium]
MHVCSAANELLSLRALLPEGELRGADDVRFGRCTCDWRRVRPGDLFAALPGGEGDGHEFAAEAVGRGAAALLCERPLAALGVPTCLVRNARDAYGRVCQALAGNPSYALKLIGVTGSNGKATTSCLVASVLAKGGHRVGLLGTLGYFDGEVVEPATQATPACEQLAAWLARMVVNGCSHAAVEVSRQALAERRLAGARLDVACVTNVGREHLDDPRATRDYRWAKSKLFDYLSPEGVAVVNADDPVAAGYLRRFQGPALTLGIHKQAEIMATPLEQCPSEQTFLLTAGSESVPVRTRMIGIHHVYNCLTAAAVGLTYGLDLTVAAAGLEAVDYVPGRLERIECGQPFSVFVDVADTPAALAGCLQALRKVTAGRLMCVLGAGRSRDRQRQALLGRTVATAADLAVVTSDAAAGEDRQAAIEIENILDGFRQSPKNPPKDKFRISRTPLAPREAGHHAERDEYGSYSSAGLKVIVDRREAIHWALAQARPGDCLLIAGRGGESGPRAAEEPLPVDDRQIAEQWLYAVQGPQ